MGSDLALRLFLIEIRIEIRESPKKQATPRTLNSDIPVFLSVERRFTPRVRTDKDRSPTRPTVGPRHRTALSPLARVVRCRWLWLTPPVTVRLSSSHVCMGNEQRPCTNEQRERRLERSWERWPRGIGIHGVQACTAVMHMATHPHWSGTEARKRNELAEMRMRKEEHSSTFPT